MQMGMIGLGRMGANMVRRLMQGNHTCVVFDLNADNVKQLRGEGATAATSLDDFASKLDKPRVAWVMVPAGGPTEPGRGDIPRTPGREQKGGTAEEGYVHCGPVGAGHFVKMVHNGIEYGLMQAYAEGFDIFRNANSESLPADIRYDLDMTDIAEVWRRGSVISSWLLDLTAMALLENPDLSNYSGFVQDSGEGRWTIMTAIEEAVPADVLSAALYTRFRSRQEHTFAEKILSAMRHKFGGHVESPSPSQPSPKMGEGRGGGQ